MTSSKLRPRGYCEAALIPRFLRPAGFDRMRIPDDILNSVMFIGTKSQGVFRPRATVFIAMAEDGDFDYLNLVTAEHVIVTLFTKQKENVPGFEEIVLRINTKSGPPIEHPTKYENWRFHPDPLKHTDVAVAPFDIPANMNCVHVPSHMFATPKIISQAKIGVGDEVSVIGLFRSHAGVGKNIPIVRTGNIASMADEPVYTKYAGYIDGYLIEARSIGGLSGSPVWVHIPPEENNKRLVELTGTPNRIYLLGLMHGHFDVRNLTEDSFADDGIEDVTANESTINTGVGIVIPAQKILETLNHPELTAMRAKLTKWVRQDKGATPDLDVSAPKSAPSTKDGNPQHKEDFTRLVGVAAKTPKPAE